jgi:hypothetical protein
MRPSTLGGFNLSKKIADFMKVNVEEIKNKPVKDADGIKDMADAIAFAIEEAMKQQFICPNPVSSMTLLAGPTPVTGTISVAGGPLYNFTLPSPEI